MSHEREELDSRYKEEQYELDARYKKERDELDRANTKFRKEWMAKQKEKAHLWVLKGWTDD